MNLFTYRKMEEDHYTNILMYILNMNSKLLLPTFLNNLLGETAKEFDFSTLKVNLFSKQPTTNQKQFEYIVGIAPYEKIEENDELENNMDSIPDAWILGNNFKLLFEFKIRGTLDNAQLAAHKRKLSNYKGTISLKWEDVVHALEAIKEEANEVQAYLIDQFILSTQTFTSKRRSSGMPKEIIGGRKSEDELHFIITGSKETNGYTVDMVLPDGTKERIHEKLSGIQHSRRWIAKYVQKNHSDLPIEYMDKKTIINDFCVKPGRLKNEWNQWYLGSFLK